MIEWIFFPVITMCRVTGIQIFAWIRVSDIIYSRNNMTQPVETKVVTPTSGGDSVSLDRVMDTLIERADRPHEIPCFRIFFERWLDASKERQSQEPGRGE